jgi:hypothetical protein
VFAEVLLEQGGASAVGGTPVSYLAALTEAGLDDERRQQETVVSTWPAAIDTAADQGSPTSRSAH